MKNVLLSFILLLAIYKLNAQQNIVILSGTSITTANNAVLVFENCNLSNSSINVNFTNALLTESGNLNTTIGGTGVLNFKQLTINKPAASLKMINDLTIQDKLIFQSGNVDLNGHILELAPLALLIGEKGTSRLVGDNGGFAAINVIMNNPNLQNPGNLGLSVTSSADMGTVSILRGHKIQSQGGLPFSIKRNYAIESNNGENFNGLMRFAYFDEELAGIDESVLQIWSSIDAANWINRGYTSKDQTLNYLQSNNLSKLEWFTMSDPTPGIGTDPIFEQRVYVSKNDADQFKLEAQLSPNPIKQNEQVWIELTVNREAKGRIQILNAVGKQIKSNPIFVKVGAQRMQLNTSEFLPGLYLIQLTFDEGCNEILKLQVH